jgi:PadR family transcriptional regulator, regulatory protein PadR
LRISQGQTHIKKVTAATDKWEVQLRKGCVELATLATLWSGRLYGLEMLRRLEYCSGLVIAEGTIYPLLGRLERGGYIKAEWVETGLGHPRKYYTLTSDGAKRTEEMTRLWKSFSSSFDQLLTPVRELPAALPFPCDTSVETGLRA